MRLYARVEQVYSPDPGVLLVSGTVTRIGGSSIPGFGFSVEMPNEPTVNAIQNAIVAQIQAVAASYGLNVPTADVQVMGL
jgi:hypothetical protein